MTPIFALCRGTLLALVAVSLVAGLGGNARGATAPIVAIFPVQAKGVALDAETLDRLGDYLAGRLAASGRYQVVPRSQIKQRLIDAKRSSYRKCYDQGCQIEIGKELAAQKTLAVQVIKLGSRCAVTATIYDLRRAATDRGATAKAGCSEDEVVGALDSVVRDLTASASPPPAPTPPTPPAPTPPPPTPGPSGPPRVDVVVQTSPPGAMVYVDGLLRGASPTSVGLTKGGTYAIELQLQGYGRRVERFVARERQELRYVLKPSAEALNRSKTRTELFTMEALVGTVQGGLDAGVGGGIYLSFFTLKWRFLTWTIAELGGGAGGDEPLVQLATRLGLPLYFGARGQHQLRLAIGLGGGLNGEAGFIASPTLHYLYQSSKSMFFGLGMRILLPAAGGDGGETTAIMFSVPMGWASRF